MILKKKYTAEKQHKIVVESRKQSTHVVAKKCEIGTTTFMIAAKSAIYSKKMRFTPEARLADSFSVILNLKVKLISAKEQRNG